MWPRREPRLSSAHLEAEAAIAATLTAGADSLPAWNALWDLVQSTDAQGKQDVLNALKSYVDNAVSNGTRRDTVSQAASQAVTQAKAFGEAIEESLTLQPSQRQVLPSNEVRKQHRDDQIEAHRQAMRDIGVRPGEGLPMWVMYMSRRSKRSWG